MGNGAIRNMVWAMRDGTIGDEAMGKGAMGNGVGAIGYGASGKFIPYRECNLPHKFYEYGVSQRPHIKYIVYD